MNCVYTCTLGNYDQVLPPTVTTTGWDYVLFSDQEATGWEYKNVDKFQAWSNSRTARNYKIKIPKEVFDNYDLSIWMDSNFEITGDMDQFVKEHHQAGLSILTHPLRSCAYDEANACKNLGKDDPVIINEQMTNYLDEGFPRGYGLPASGVMIRSHTKEVKEFCNVWWSEVKTWSKRDQLSFSYSTWKTGFTPYYMGYNYLLHRHYFKIHSHLKNNKGKEVWG